jgi:hypothetical protein
MIILTSPAKSQDFDSNWQSDITTQPQFLKEADELAKKLKQFSKEELAKLLSISDNLAELNYERYQHWQPNNNRDIAKPALMVYSGDVYKPIKVEQYDEAQKQRLQKSLRIISGLYGVLKPFDLIQPYRLEMKTDLTSENHENLYDFWGDKLTKSLQKEIANAEHKLIVNLASNEYERAVDLKKLRAEVINIEFRQRRDGEMKNYGIIAKKMRGEMIDFIIRENCKKVEDIKKFDRQGYKYLKSEERSIFFVGK